MTRDEHLAWCKQRALEYVDNDDLALAYASMVSDMSKHPETKDHAALELGAMLLINGFLDSRHEMREFIEGFH